jgi:hypothetical protein
VWRIWRRCLVVLALANGIASAFADDPSDLAEPLYPVFAEGRWGLIDAAGQLVLPVRFEAIAGWPVSAPGPRLPNPVQAVMDIPSREPVRDRVIPVRLDGQTALATRDGRLLAAGRYEAMGQFSEGRIWVRSGSHYGFADGNGELVIPASFTQVQSFAGGYAFVKVGTLWGVIDREGETVVSPTWDEVGRSSRGEWVKVRKGERWGVMERSGAVVIPPALEQIQEDPSPPLIWAIDSGHVVYIRPDGSTAFRLECPRGRFRTPEARGYPFFRRNSAVVQCGNRYGVIDTLGHFLLEPTWERITAIPNARVYEVSSGKNRGIIDDAGRWIFGPTTRYGSVSVCADGLLNVSVPGPRWGFIDFEGNEVIPLSFFSTSCFNEGLAAAWTGKGAGFIDTTGVWAIPPRFWRTDPFRGPLAVVKRPVARDTLEVGYIDRSGNVVYRMQLEGFIHDDELVDRFR